MKKKLFLIITILLFTSSISFSQYDISIKAYATYGFISPKDLNDFLSDKQNKMDIVPDNEKYLSYSAARKLNLTSIERINELISYGCEVNYKLNDRYKIGLGIEYSYLLNDAYLYYKNDFAFVDPPVIFGWNQYKTRINNYSFPLVFYFNYPITIFSELNLHVGINLNYSFLKNTYKFHYYDQTQQDSKLSFNSYASSLGYQVGVGYGFKIHPNVVLNFEGRYNNKDFSSYTISNGDNKVKLVQTSTVAETYYSLSESAEWNDKSDNFGLNLSAFSILAGISINLF